MAFANIFLCPTATSWACIRKYHPGRVYAPNADQQANAHIPTIDELRAHVAEKFPTIVLGDGKVSFAT